MALLAYDTDGRAFAVRDVASLPQFFRRLALSSFICSVWRTCGLGEAYTIGYVPADPTRDGKYRTIRVTVEPPSGQKLEIQVRAGYFAPVDRGDQRLHESIRFWGSWNSLIQAAAHAF